jgi:hypothetical protein
LVRPENIRKACSARRTNFGKPIAWFAMPPEHAINFARLLLRHAGVKKVEIEL